MDVNESEVAALVARGYLPEEVRGDPAAIKAAIEGVISEPLLLGHRSCSSCCESRQCCGSRLFSQKIAAVTSGGTCSV